MIQGSPASAQKVIGERTGFWQAVIIQEICALGFHDDQTVDFITIGFLKPFSNTFKPLQDELIRVIATASESICTDSRFVTF